MASDENSDPPPINRPATGTSPTVTHTKSDTEVSSSPTIILMTSDSSSSTTSVHSLEKKRLADNHSELPNVSTRKRRPYKKCPIAQLAARLRIREFFVARLVLVSNVMCSLAIFGIVLMVVEKELTFSRLDNQDTKVSWFIKLIITITTIILLGLIIYYHYLDISLYSFRNSIDHWRVRLTTTKILLIAIEIVICAVHPMPRSYPQSDPAKIDSNSTTSDSSTLGPYPISYTDVDVGLGLAMFLRLYLLSRPIVLHSHLVRELSLRSIGYMNQVSIDFFFLMKTYLERWPTRCLIVLCSIIFLIGSWCLRACDYEPTREHLSLSDAMWLFIITYTTVGYGDIYPSTYCGRSIAAIIGLIGLLSSALLIAILAKKLLLSREEKYVHTFVLNTRLIRERKNQSANIIQFAWKSWCLKRQDKSTSIQYFLAQRKFFKSIHHLQQIKQDQRNLVDACVGFTELMTTHHKTHARTEQASEEIATIKSDVKKIEKRLNSMTHDMKTLQKTLNVILDTITK